MTWLFNESAGFADEMLAGFVAAHRDLVRRVPGGVVRATRAEAVKVAVVVGGGSGHYPAFAGLVGPGMADGAALGNVFASPSARQVCSVASAADRGAGVLLCFGNYAGDVLHFGQAADMLNGNGIQTLTLAVTDDISSAPADRADLRRGVAGDLAVFKVAAAAADAGLSLQDVHRVATRANDRTRTLGVALSGCTLPGADKPLFSVPQGRMAVGMGIHGEPGTGETDVPTADGLAHLLVSALLTDLPDDLDDVRGARAGLILNGLGTVKYEELYVLYRRLAELLDEHGVVIVEPEVGEFVTSYDMAGVSLTLFWLDDQLEKYWAAPAYTPAYRKGRLPHLDSVVVDEQPAAPIAQWMDTAAAPGGEASRAAARVVVQALTAIRVTIDENVEYLGDIDAVAGDGDHGIGMQRGVRAAVDAATAAHAAGAGAGAVLTAAANAWADRAGGTSGALWGLGLRELGATLGNDGTPAARDVSDGITAALTSIQQLGKAQIGDKTLVDVLAPASDALSTAIAEGHRLDAAFAIAADTADRAAKATANLLPKIGRARPLAEKSLGTPDAGATSMALAFHAVSHTLTTTCQPTTPTPSHSPVSNDGRNTAAYQGRKS